MSHRCDAGERLENILEDRVSRRAAPLRSLVRWEGTVILCDLSREERGASVDQRSHNRGGRDSTGSPTRSHGEVGAG